MKIIDTNMILRLLMRDDEKAADIVEELIKNDKVLVMPEVIAEVVYVMTKVYKIDRRTTVVAISAFLDVDNVETEKSDAVKKGLEYYGKTSLDFVDCLLCAYNTVSGYEICTFDKKLNNLIKRENGI